MNNKRSNHIEPKVLIKQSNERFDEDYDDTVEEFIQMQHLWKLVATFSYSEWTE